MVIAISIISTIVIIYILLTCVGIYTRNKAKTEMKELGEKALDYIANHTYQQFIKDLSSRTCTRDCLQANVILTNFMKHTKTNTKDENVYKDIQMWRRENKI